MTPGGSPKLRIAELRARLRGDQLAEATAVELHAEAQTIPAATPVEVPAACRLPAHGPVLRRAVWRPGQRPTVWVPTPRDAAELVASLPAGVPRVFLVGTVADGTRAGARAWCYAAPLPAGWSHGAHYIEDADALVLRFAHEDGRRVTVLRAEAWFGDPRLGHCAAYSATDAERAWFLLARCVADHFDGAELHDTPGTTGRRALARLIPAGIEYPTVSAELQELLRATSGQGRIELIAEPGARLPALYEYDGRLMYGALLRELGTAVALHDHEPTFAGHASAWYRVRATVPGDWSHVGILPAPSDDGSWCWPAEPRRTFSAWCSGAELHVALTHGWSIEIRERIIFGRGKPLDGWQRAFIGAASRVEARLAARDGEPWQLVRAALRSILLHSIGSFHGRTRSLSRSLPLAEAGAVPKHAVDVRVEGDRIAWNEPERAAWPEMSRPEWSTQVWARARARLLVAPLDTGALRVPRSELVAFRTDAIYCTSALPWRDDGKPGRYRLKLRIDGPLVAPKNQTELLEARRGA